MEHCPTCQARLKFTTVCPRCGTETVILQKMDGLAIQLQHQAIHLLAQNDLKGASQAIEQALILKIHPLTMVLRNFIRYRAQETRRQRLIACVETFLTEDQQNA